MHVSQIEHRLWVLALIAGVLVVRCGSLVILLGAEATETRKTSTFQPLVGHSRDLLIEVVA